MNMRRTLSVVVAMVVALFAGVLPAQAATSYPPKAPTITIDKTRVSPGDTATVTATGCQPSTSGSPRTATVTVTAPGHKVTQTQSVPVGSDLDGTVTATVTFTVLGSNVVSVTCVDPNGKSLTQSVRVNVVPAAAIWANHTSVTAGGKVTVSASGYAPNSTATVTVLSSGGSTVSTTTVTTDANGVATVTLTFPKAGVFTVRVLGMTVAGTPLAQSIAITVVGAVMPHTGADLVPFSVGGVGLLLAGVALVAATRRRRRVPA